VQCKLAGLMQGLLMLGLLCSPLAGAEYQDPPHVAPATPAVAVTARAGTTGTSANNTPNATGWDPVPLGDTAAFLPNIGADTGPYNYQTDLEQRLRKIRVLSRTLKPPAGLVFAQYPVDKKWYDSIPGDTDSFPVGDFSAPGPNSISVYRTFFNTKVPDANNFPWRLEGNLAGGAGGGQAHWGAKVSKPALPGDLAFVFSDRPKIGTDNVVYVAVLIIPSQAIVDGLSNGGYIITKRTQTYTRDGQEVTEVVYYGGKIPANLDSANNVYYGLNGSHSGGPHMTSDGRIALSYDVLINNGIDAGPGSIESPTSVAIETRVFSGDPGDAFGAAVNKAKEYDHNRTGLPDENEYDHKSNSYFGKESDTNTFRGTLVNGTPGSKLLKSATCSFTLPNTEGYTSPGIQDPPQDLSSRVTRPVNSGTGRYENASAIPKKP